MFLDSTVLIGFLRNEPNAIEVIKRIEDKQLYTSEINVFELIQGVYISHKNVEQHIQQIIGILSTITVLPFDRRAAIKAGVIGGMLQKHGQKIGEADCLIAGVALANGIKIIVTNNTEHFERIPGLRVMSY